MIMLAILALLFSCEPLHVDDLPHSITYTLDGGYWPDEAPRTKAVFNNIVVLPECEKTGYTLTGWKSDQVKVQGTTETEFSFIVKLLFNSAEPPRLCCGEEPTLKKNIIM